MAVICDNLSSADIVALREMEQDDGRPRGRRPRKLSFWVGAIEQIYDRAGVGEFQYTLVRDLGGASWLMSSLHAKGFVRKIGVDNRRRGRWRLTAKGIRLLSTDTGGGAAWDQD